MLRNPANINWLGAERRRMPIHLVLQLTRLRFYNPEHGVCLYSIKLEEAGSTLSERHEEKEKIKMMTLSRFAAG